MADYKMECLPSTITNPDILWLSQITFKLIEMRKRRGVGTTSLFIILLLYFFIFLILRQHWQLIPITKLITTVISLAYHQNNVVDTFETSNNISGDLKYARPWHIWNISRY